MNFDEFLKLFLGASVLGRLRLLILVLICSDWKEKPLEHCTAIPLDWNDGVILHIRYQYVNCRPRIHYNQYMFIQLRNMFDSSLTDMFFASIQILLQIASKSRLFDRTRLRVEAGANEAEVWKFQGS